MSKITWGDTVRVIRSAHREARPGSLASVCAIIEVETEEHARSVGFPVGTTVYLVEFGDGASVEISGELLEKVEDDG